MRIAVILDVDRKTVQRVEELVREFVRQNTLLINNAESHEVAETRGAVREEGSNVGHLVLVGDPVRIL